MPNPSKKPRRPAPGPSKSLPITIETAPGEVIIQQCSPPRDDCESILGKRSTKWRKIQIEIDEADLRDSRFETEKERALIEAWIVRLIKRDLGTWLGVASKGSKIRVTIESATASAINKALVARAAGSGDDDCGSCKH